MKNIFVFSFACIALIACNSTPKVDIVAEAEAIRNIENQWTVALQNKDIDKVMSLYSSDAVVMIPDNSTFVGLQNIRKQTESEFADTTALWNTTSTTIDIIEVSASGDIAYARGINRGNVKTENGIVENAVKWIDIYKKIDGQWKVIVSIWNSNNP